MHVQEYAYVLVFGVNIKRADIFRCDTFFCHFLGNILHSVVKLKDVTQQKSQQEEAVANKLRVEFFNTLSHELRTPLK